jgi:hypothetical protein
VIVDLVSDLLDSLFYFLSGCHFISNLPLV